MPADSRSDNKYASKGERENVGLFIDLSELMSDNESPMRSRTFERTDTQPFQPQPDPSVGTNTASSSTVNSHRGHLEGPYPLKRSEQDELECEYNKEGSQKNLALLKLYVKEPVYPTLSDYLASNNTSDPTEILTPKLSPERDSGEVSWRSIAVDTAEIQIDRANSPPPGNASVDKPRSAPLCTGGCGKPRETRRKDKVNVKDRSKSGNRMSDKPIVRKTKLKRPRREVIDSKTRTLICPDTKLDNSCNWSSRQPESSGKLNVVYVAKRRNDDRSITEVDTPQEGIRRTPLSEYTYSKMLRPLSPSDRLGQIGDAHSDHISQLQTYEILSWNKDLSRLEEQLEEILKKTKTRILSEMVNLCNRQKREWGVKLAELSCEQDLQTKEMDIRMRRHMNEAHSKELALLRRDKILGNITQELNKTKDKLKVFKAFAAWKALHEDMKKEEQMTLLMKRHLEKNLKRRVLIAWRAIIQENWKKMTTRVCMAKAEEVCFQLAKEYEDKIETLSCELNQARTANEDMKKDKENYELETKQSFYRGVCALNMEAMKVFRSRCGNDLESKPIQSKLTQIKTIQLNEGIQPSEECFSANGIFPADIGKPKKKKDCRCKKEAHPVAKDGLANDEEVMQKVKVLRRRMNSKKTVRSSKTNDKKRVACKEIISTFEIDPYSRLHSRRQKT